ERLGAGHSAAFADRTGESLLESVESAGSGAEPRHKFRIAREMSPASSHLAEQSHAHRAGYPLRSAVLVAACCLFATGCASFHIGSPGGDSEDKSPKPPLVAAPSKYPYRVSQFAFLTDFELKPEPPLFGELRDLPEQVYKELQLPAAKVVIQVYVFEDRDRYQRFMQSRYPD